MVLTKQELIPLLRDPEICKIIHEYSDLDTEAQAQHHSLGVGKNKGALHKTVVDLTTPDDIAPAQVTGVTFNSAIVTNNDGVKVAEVTISWTPVTTNSDGSPIDDLDEYRISWKKHSSTDWSPAASVNPDTPVAFYYGFKVGEVVDFRVRALDKTGNKGAFGYSLNNTVVPDTTGPNVPSTPTIINRMGGLRIQWDGKDQSGGAMPPDFAYCEVHVSSTNGFTPSTSTKYDSLPTAGASIYSSNAYGTTFYVRLVAYDRSGNASGVSIQASGTPLQGVDADFANVSVTKLIAGYFSADVGLAGRFKIGPLNADGTLVSPLGARVELNSTGLHLFNGSNVEVGTLAVVSGVPSINIQGPIVSGGTITGATIEGGIVQTASSGSRVVIDSSVQDRVRFYTSGTLAASFVASGTSGTPGLDINGTSYVNINTSGVVIEIGAATASPYNMQISAGEVAFTGIVDIAAGLFAYGGISCPGSNADPLTLYAIATATSNTPTLRTDASGQVLQISSASSRKYKRNIEELTLEDIEKVLDIDVVKFQYRSSYYKAYDVDRIRWGGIAEQVHELGLEPLVDYHEETWEPDNIDYSRIGIMLIPIVKDLRNRVKALEGV